jgi:hypothetical protein
MFPRQGKRCVPGHPGSLIIAWHISGRGFMHNGRLLCANWSCRGTDIWKQFVRLALSTVSLPERFVSVRSLQCRTRHFCLQNLSLQP